jgi:hypothetical protein
MEALRVRQAEATYLNALGVNRWAGFVAVVAGTLAVPPLASVVLGPLWRWQG